MASPIVRTFDFFANLVCEVSVLFMCCHSLVFTGVSCALDVLLHFLLYSCLYAVSLYVSACLTETL